MGWSKREIIEEAYSELGIGPEFDITPDEQITALKRLDTMMATWEADKGIRVGYAFSASPSAADPDADSGLPDYAVRAAYLNLAIDLAPGFGKEVKPTTQVAARNAYGALLLKAAQPPQQQQRGTFPRGSGNKAWQTSHAHFYPPPTDSPLDVDSTGLNISTE